MTMQIEGRISRNVDNNDDPLDLSDPTEFLKKLDQKAAKLRIEQSVLLEFFVKGDKMTVFLYEGVPEAYYTELANNPDGLVCAGRIGVLFSPTGIQHREIFGHNERLAKEKVLDRKASNSFKFSELQQKLGSFFTIAY